MSNGYDQGHEYENGRDCDLEHVHTHGHVHEHPYIDEGVVSISRHDDAIIGSLLLHHHTQQKASSVWLESSLEELSKQVSAQGGIIGHIKASLTELESTTFSTTGTRVNRIATGEVCADMEIVAIIINIEEETLRTLMNRIFLLQAAEH